MISAFKIRPYKVGSKSAKSLAEELGAKRLRLDESTYVPRSSHLVINWGNSSEFPFDVTQPGRILNYPAAIRTAANKADFFRHMRNVEMEEILPPFWPNEKDIPEDDESIYPIVCRTVLSGHSGDGIVIADTPADLVAGCGLYVQYVKKSEEYRVHVDKVGTVISIQRKARKLSVPSEEVNWQVRNLAGGFVFVRDNVNPPAAVIDVAGQAVALSGLDFGAVDVIWNDKKEKAYVLEINTAPGLEGQTVRDYAEYFRVLAS